MTPVTPADEIVVGLGTRRGVTLEELRAALRTTVTGRITALLTAQARADEPALRELADLLGVPLRTFAAAELRAQPAPNGSERVRQAVGTPSVAEAAVLAAGAELTTTKQVVGRVTVAVGRAAAGYDLAHHGDAEVGEGLVDLAVNVRGPAPDWLTRRITAAVGRLAAYPDPRAATAAVAERHARPAGQVLLTAGAAEAFVLLARALTPKRAVVVHPQFTEPEAALRAAGHAVDRVVLEPPYVLDPAAVPADADLVVVGNPTNPTSVLHPADTLLALTRPGRVLLVDEAFLDAVPGEPESLAHVRRSGLVVTRSLTKTWGLAGLRIGYLLGDEEVLRRCADAQPLWSVSTPALEAALATSEPRAVAEAGATAAAAERDRQYLESRLGGVPDLTVTTPARAPFLLIEAHGPDPAGVHGRLRAAGWAVRRADTFPGLGPGHLRAAVRDRATSDAFAAALDRAVHPR